MHAKVFSIQIFQYFSQIVPRVCTLVLFIIIIIIIIIIITIITIIIVIIVIIVINEFYNTINEEVDDIT